MTKVTKIVEALGHRVEFSAESTDDTKTVEQLFQSIPPYPESENDKYDRIMAAGIKRGNHRA